MSTAKSSYRAATVGLLVGMSLFNLAPFVFVYVLGSGDRGSVPERVTILEYTFMGGIMLHLLTGGVLFWILTVLGGAFGFFVGAKYSKWVSQKTLDPGNETKQAG